MTAPSAKVPEPRGNGHTETFRFATPSRLEYRDAARAFIAFICEQLQQREALPADVGHRVISAFIEAFNNAVIHAYQGASDGTVEVELQVSADKILLRVIDEGTSFRPDAVPEPDLDALPEGGMGLYIMRSFMDSVDYRRERNRNVLTMEKSLRNS